MNNESDYFTDSRSITVLLSPEQYNCRDHFCHPDGALSSCQALIVNIGSLLLYTVIFGRT